MGIDLISKKIYKNLPQNNSLNVTSVTWNYPGNQEGNFCTFGKIQQHFLLILQEDAFQWQCMNSLKKLATKASSIFVTKSKKDIDGMLSSNVLDISLSLHT
jgi:hypothetical protein